MTRRHWKGPEERAGPLPGARDEFPAPPALEPASRRSFLKLAGFTLGSAALTGCSRGIERKALPLLVPAEEVVPGRASWYATLCGGCDAGCGVLAKSRDGRPIKIEGNPEHPLSRGAVCAAGQAYLLGLYDSHRLDGPRVDGAPCSWAEADAALAAELDAIARGGGKVRVLTGTVNGPTERAAIAAFLARFPGARHVMYDALSASALLDAHAELFGVRAAPRYRLDRAAVIVSFDADFLGTWLSPAELTRAYAAGRDPDGAFSHHTQLEPRLSLTGAKADERVALAPDEIGPALARLAALVAAGGGAGARAAGTGAGGAAVEAAAARLLAAPRGSAVVLCGTNDPDHQRLVAWTNHLLGAYGAVADLARPSYQKLGDDRALAELRAEIARGEVAALVIARCNPLYDLPGGLALEKVPLVVGTAEREDETGAAARFLCPDHHPLEAWRDAEPVAGLVTVSQPLVEPLRGTRALAESLAAWAGRPADARTLMRETWRRELFPRQARHAGFEAFWAAAVHDGFAEFERAESPRAPAAAPLPPPSSAAEDLMVVLHPKVGLLDGRHAHNAWLHELPDPASKVVWDNYAALAPATARRLGLADGDLVRVAAGEAAVTLPVRVQPGTHPRVVAVALGYGRKGTDRFAAVGPAWLEGEATVAKGSTVGANGAPLLGWKGKYVSYEGAVTLAKAGGRRALASTQLHHSLREPEALGGAHRPHVRETTVAAWRRGGEGREAEKHAAEPLWPPDHRYEGHRWAMAIDLTACTGCSACVVSCQAENNVPVVGRDEVARQREMHWLRIDRYYAGDPDDPDVVVQPMLCQHCDDAPCESVCPVLATVHSSEGLNQQVYNRCVGTRYCANNCPYKTRRFNWFDYQRGDELAHLVLNPDIVVRMRGVMEKCSFCVQRIQEAKAEARREGRPVRDGDVQPACAQSCPARAIRFGDRNDPEAAVARAARDGRHYHVLEEVGTRPSVAYRPLVRHRGEEHHG